MRASRGSVIESMLDLGFPLMFSLLCVCVGSTEHGGSLGADIVFRPALLLIIEIMALLPQKIAHSS